MSKEATPSIESVLNTQNKLMEQLISNQPRKHKTVAEYDPKSAFNPIGKRDRKLPAVVFQNGVRLDETVLHDSEIELLGKLKPGRFCDNLVTVRQNTSSVDREFYIDYSNKTADKRMALKDQFRSFGELLKRLTTEEPAE